MVDTVSLLKALPHSDPFASSSETEPAIMTSSPGSQLARVATLWLAVSCRYYTADRWSSSGIPHEVPIGLTPTAVCEQYQCLC